MIKRYENPVIARIWKDEQKVAAWQKVELAVIEARAALRIIPSKTFMDIRTLLELHPTDLDWWKAREKETNHDLQAWVEERVRHLPTDSRQYFHEGMTSYDTEETAFLILIKQSVDCVFEGCAALENALKAQALKYRNCPMMGVTHGQFAEVQTFGKRCLTWYREIVSAKQKVGDNLWQLRTSKISGAIGNYGGVTPQIEEKALQILGFKPYYGATQILPRQLHASLAEALTALALVVSKIGADIRLGARSPRPIYQEPFGKKQTGSSRMPQKKNTIATEQLEGMGRMALGYLVMIMQNIVTWEERGIEQSSVERVAWSDLFHVTMRSLTSCSKVIEGLQIYPDNMVRDILDTRGTWAAGPAKEFLRERLAPLGITTEETYRIVQLASFMAFQPTDWSLDSRKDPPKSLAEGGGLLTCAQNAVLVKPTSIQQIIACSELRVVSDLEVNQEQVDMWNRALYQLFEPLRGTSDDWQKVFSVQDRLKDEAHLFKQVFGV